MEGIRVARSSDRGFRQAACDISDYFVDVPYEGEIVRARPAGGALKLHQGGDRFITFPSRTGEQFAKEQISPTRDSRLRWMQSVIHCTHYVCGAGEQQYLRKEDAPGVVYVNRDTIERADEAYIDIA